MEASMKAPMYFRGSGCHGHFHESSGSFQILPECCAKVMEVNYNRWKYAEANGSTSCSPEAPRKLSLTLPRKFPLVNSSEASSFHERGINSFHGSGGSFYHFSGSFHYFHAGFYYFDVSFFPSLPSTCSPKYTWNYYVFRDEMETDLSLHRRTKL